MFAIICKDNLELELLQAGPSRCSAQCTQLWKGASYGSLLPTSHLCPSLAGAGHSFQIHLTAVELFAS